MTPIEKIARAICERADINPDKMITLMQPHHSELIGPFGYEKASRFAPAWQFFVPHAMAAMGAMRSAVPDAMIDAALAEQPDAATADPDPA